jgi:superfamily II DNA/RNA helicase
MGPQLAALAAGPQIVIGTPGRVLDLLRQGALHLDRVTYVVLDEADEMLDRGFAPDVERILGFAPRERQTALFSATVPEWVQGTASKHLRNPETVQIDTKPEDAPKIEHIIYDVPEGQKLPVLRILLDGRGDESVLVFGRTKHGVKKLARQLVALGYPAAALQGNLSQNARDKVMTDFRAATVPILLATNVAARGLDVEHIGLVINYELPETTELLTHRVGRTGRMGREGDAITLLVPSDEAKWRQLSRGLAMRIPRKKWTGALPEVPAAIEAFPLYPKREERRARTDRPAPAPRSAATPREHAAAAKPIRHLERPAASARPARPEREAPARRPAAALDPARFRFSAGAADVDRAIVRDAAVEHEPATTAAPGFLPPTLSTQIDALLTRFQTSGTVMTPKEVPLTRRAPQRAQREQHVAASASDAEETRPARPERRSDRGRSFAPTASLTTGDDPTTGVITKIVKARGFGFLRDGAGVERFFHRNDVTGVAFEKLQVSQSVRFTPEAESNGPRPRALAVQPLS